MKASIIVILFLLCSQLLSQIDNRDRINRSDILLDRINSDSNIYEQIKHPLESFNFRDRESEAMLNKILIDNGFF